MLKYRLISFPLLFAVFLIMVLSRTYGPILFAVLAPLILAMAAYELLTMLGKIDQPSYPKTTALLLLLFSLPLVCARFFSGIGLFESLASACWILAMTLPLLLLLALLFAHDRRKAFLGAVNSLGAIYLLASCYAPLLFLYDANLSTRARALSGLTAFFFLVVVTKMMDTGGYIFGKLSNSLQKNGNHKIVPSISPGKSYEGAVGGMLFSVGAALIFYACDASPFSLWWTVGAGVILALGSFAGDLTESVFKRVCGVKDSNSIIPGMGGVLDVVDSFLYNGMLFFLLLWVAR